MSLQLQQYTAFSLSPKALRDTLKVLKRRLRPWAPPRTQLGSSRRSPDPLVGLGRGHFLLFPSTSSASRYQRLCMMLHFSESLRNCFFVRPLGACTHRNTRSCSGLWCAWCSHWSRIGTRPPQRPAVSPSPAPVPPRPLYRHEAA